MLMSVIIVTRWDETLCFSVCLLRWRWKWLRQRHRGQSAELWSGAAEGVSSANHYEGQRSPGRQWNKHTDDRDWRRQRQCPQRRTQRHLRIQLPRWVLVFCIYSHLQLLLLGSRVVSMLDSGTEGPGFKAQPRCCRVTILGKLFTPILPLFTKQQHW